jgi:hypothetical protein
LKKKEKNFHLENLLMNQSASVFAKCGSRMKPCVCCVQSSDVQSSDPRFSNACGEPMAPPPLQPKGLGSKLKAHMLLPRQST